MTDLKSTTCRLSAKLYGGDSYDKDVATDREFPATHKGLLLTNLDWSVATRHQGSTCVLIVTQLTPTELYIGYCAVRVPNAEEFKDETITVDAMFITVLYWKCKVIFTLREKTVCMTGFKLNWELFKGRE